MVQSTIVNVRSRNIFNTGLLSWLFFSRYILRNVYVREREFTRNE